jgi:hypothetical protein
MEINTATIQEVLALLNAYDGASLVGLCDLEVMLWPEAEMKTLAVVSGWMDSEAELRAYAADYTDALRILVLFVLSFCFHLSLWKGGRGFWGYRARYFQRNSLEIHSNHFFISQYY